MLAPEASFSWETAGFKYALITFQARIDRFAKSLRS